MVEEEFEHARARKLPVLVFLEDVPRDAEAERFAKSLSDYVDGTFRVKFSGASNSGTRSNARCGPCGYAKQSTHGP